MAAALDSATGFVAFELSPEPELAPPPPPSRPSSSTPHAAGTPASSSRGASSHSAKGKERESRDPYSSSSKRRRDDRDEDDDDEQPYRSKKDERRASSRATPWTEGIDWFSCRNPAEMLNREITAFIDYISPSPTEHATRTHIIALVNRAIVTQWPDASVLPFGSYETGLYLPTGDIDLVIQSDSISMQKKESVLHTIAAVLRRANLAENIQVISKTKVPIVKFISSYGRLPVDISLNQTNGVSAGKIVNSYISALPALKPLVLVIKSFLSQRGMNEVFSGGLGSYSVICLVISFLQVHPKVRRAEIDPLVNLGVLLIEFFELYGKNFGYDDSGITLRDGGGYFDKRTRGWSNPKQPYLLSIEDPQDDSNDISKSSYGVLRVKSTFAGAYEVLTSRLYVRAGEIADRRSGRSRPGRGDGWGTGDDPQHSVLVGIMGVSPDVFKHRAILKDLHRSGVLQKMLGIPQDAPLISLPSFTQKASDSSQSKKHKRFSRSPSPTRSSSATRRRISSGSDRMTAIVVEDEDEDDRRPGGYVSSDSSIASFVDKPFKPTMPKSSAAPLPMKPSVPPTASATASSSAPGKISRPTSQPKSSRAASPASSPEESRYARAPDAKRSRKSKKKDSFSVAPSAALKRVDSSRGGTDSDSDDEDAVEDEIYIEGQEELLPSDEDVEEGEVKEKKGRKDKEDDEDDEAERRASKAQRRARREAKRQFWKSKGGVESMGGTL